MMKSFKINRNTGMGFAICASLLISACQSDQSEPTSPIYLGSGGKAGEVTDTSAVVLARLTSADSQDKNLLIPGTEGQARIIYSTDAEFKSSKTTNWFDAVEYTDYAAQITLSDLAPKTRQYYKVEMRADENSKTFTSGRKSFKTAPAADDDAAVHFQITTGNTYDVSPSYLTMVEQDPDFRALWHAPQPAVFRCQESCQLRRPNHRV